MMKRNFYLVFVFLLNACVWSTLTAGEYEIVIERLTQEYVAEKDTNAVYRSFQTLQPDGSWHDIDYQDRGNAVWLPKEHLTRLQQMAYAWNDSSHSLYHSPELLKSIITGLEYWYQVKPTSINWWHNDIGKQHCLAKIAIVLSNELPDSVLTLIKEDLATSIGRHTGQNLLWVAEEMIWRGLLDKDADLLKAGVEAIQNVLVISEKEGIMPDYSFRQHGPQLYSGGAGYGTPFLTSNIQWAYCLQGLSFAYPEEKIDILRNYILDGSNWMIRRGFWDFQTTGRTLVRKKTLRSTPLLHYLELMAEFDLSHTPEYQGFINHIKGENDNYLTGNKHFPWSDYVVHRRANYFFSVNMNSVRTYRTENGNNENVKGLYLSDGGTTLLINGDEYEEIFPCWNWSRIPGVTAPNRPEIPTFKGWGYAGTTHFVGAVSDGRNGVAVYQMDYDNTQVNKGWFMFDEAIVCLASDIRCGSSFPVTTTLNQTNRKGTVMVNTPEGYSLMVEEDNFVKNIFVERVWHNRIGYILPDTDKVSVTIENRSGDWSKIGAYPENTMQEQNVFELSKVHHLSEKENSFAYILVPGIAMDEFDTYDASYIDILFNTPSCQAVHNKKENIYGVINYQSGNVNLSTELSVFTSEPCVLLLNVEGNTPIMTVSDPTQQLEKMTVNIHYKGKDFSTELNFPTGAAKGNSVVYRF